MRVGTCRVRLRELRGGEIKLGKSVFAWDVPQDMVTLAKKYGKTFIGVNTWKDQPRKKYVCIAQPKSEYPIYLEKQALTTLIRELEQ